MFIYNQILNHDMCKCFGWSVALSHLKFEPPKLMLIFQLSDWLFFLVVP